MILDTSLLPNKLNDINYFKKLKDGCEIYSYAGKVTTRNEVIVIKLDTQIEKDFCVDSKAIEMVRALQPADITITDKSFIIKSTNGKGKFTSRLLSEGLFDLSSNELLREINVDIDKLVKASQYVSKNDKKPVLTGVRVDSEGNIYSSDSFKAYFHIPHSLSNDGITIPVAFINLTKTLLNDIKDINIYYNNNILMVENGNIKLYGRLIEGNYPNMEKIISNIQYAKEVEVDVEELLDRLNIAQNVGSDEDKKTTICLSQNKIEALGDDNYEAEIKFDNQNEFCAKMQLESLSQALKNVNKPSLRFLVKDGIGLMAFVLNEEEKEISLVLCAK